MAKLIPIVDSKGNKLGYCFKCPGCEDHGHIHQFCTHDHYTEGWPIWELTGTLESPTIRASLLYWWNEGEEHIPHRCHSFITDGKIQFLGDCTHKLVGQIVELPEID